MVLESTLICLDNSDYMINGDYSPSRLEAQYDAAGLLCNDRTSTNPENTVGIISMSKGVELLASPTEDIGKILASFSKIKIGGSSDFLTAVQIAELALKHRKNKNGGQRIVVFVGSPIIETIEKMLKVGKLLKKNGIAVDVINFGQIDENQEKLLEFVNAVNSNDNSHLINVPAGLSPADAVISSPLMQDSPFAAAGVGAGGAGRGNFDDFGGVDPEMDPELAMALRISTEEARAQEEAAAKSMSQESKSQDQLNTSSHAAEEEDEETLMQRALELSMREAAGDVSASVVSSSSAVMETEDLDEDEALRRALELSMMNDEASANISTSATEEALNSDYLQSLLASVGSNMDDPLIQAALAQINGSQPTENKPSNKRKSDEEEDNNSESK